MALRFKDRLLHFEAIIALLLAWVMVFILPFWCCRRLFGGITTVSSSFATNLTTEQRVRARIMAGRMRKIANRMPWQSTCLVRALAGRLLLMRRRIPGGTVRFGVKMNERGGVDAHAWLILGDEILLGADEAVAFQALADLGRTP